MRNDQSRARERDRIWVETPFEDPEPRVVVAAARAGALGILDLGAGRDRAREALDLVVRRTDAAFGVRVSARCPLGPDDLPDAVDTVVVADAELAAPWRATSRRVVVEVRSADEARAALAAGPDDSG